MTDPIRLKDASKEVYARDLAEASRAEFHYDQAKGAAALGIAIRSTSTATPHVGLKAGLLAKLLVGGAVVIGACVVAWWMSHQEAAPVMTTTPAPVASAVSSRTETARAPEALTTPVIASSPPNKPVPTVIRTPQPSASATSSGTLAEETMNLATIRRTAKTDPAAALSLVDQSNMRFANGAFREERESIAVGCLADLHRPDEARKRARAFLRAYPSSAFSDQVRQSGGLD